MRPTAFAGLICSIALVLALGFPWGEIVGHSHWLRIEWIPFSRPLRPGDIIGNLLLCAPVGLFAGFVTTRPRLVVGATTLLLSVFIESTQLYTHTRFPSATDVLCNVTGAIVVAGVAQAYRVHAKKGVSP